MSGSGWLCATPKPTVARLTLPVRACAQHSQRAGLLWAACGPKTALAFLSAPPMASAGGQNRTPNALEVSCRPRLAQELQMSPAGARRTFGNCAQHLVPSPRAGGRMNGLIAPSSCTANAATCPDGGVRGSSSFTAVLC